MCSFDQHVCVANGVTGILTVTAGVGVFDGVGGGVAGFEGVNAAVDVADCAGVTGGVREGLADAAGEPVAAADIDDVGVEAAVCDDVTVFVDALEVDGEPVRVDAALRVDDLVAAAERVGVLVLAADNDADPEGDADEDDDTDDVVDAVAAAVVEDDAVLVVAAVCECVAATVRVDVMVGRCVPVFDADAL